MWKILQEPCIPQIVTLYFTRLFVHLLFQAYFSTLHTPEEVDEFWKTCQKEHGFAASPNRFALETLKSLLCRMQCEGVVMAMERKCGWDMLLSADTQHYAVGLLVRVMRSSSIPLSSGIALYLLRLLSMATSLASCSHSCLRRCPCPVFLSGPSPVLGCLDVTKYGASLLEIISTNLQSECRERRHLALRCLMVLGPMNPAMAKKMWNLTENLVDVLQENDSFMVRMTIVVLRYLFLYNGAPIRSPVALRLAEALLPLFDSDDSQVQLGSITVFEEMIDLLRKEERKALKTQVWQRLLPLFIHCHDENPRVAEASQQALLRVAEFLKRRNLMQLVNTAELWQFAECLPFKS
ncbi:PREDICTED: maestro heat-like repeat-containing protein family member 1 [Ficedula albicollis]|uniref:maestro heat-like repeat-containing protein family member 1 n=1 Tax=Ficedula albicollis TaxID=59894 RepID=UPI0007AD79EC|nr:PREDICTED: maestro heat-like repeat-containing protein family member 1 [Ficedula albicollis]